MVEYLVLSIIVLCQGIITIYLYIDIRRVAYELYTFYSFRCPSYTDPHEAIAMLKTGLVLAVSVTLKYCKKVAVLGIYPS